MSKTYRFDPRDAERQPLRGEWLTRAYTVTLDDSSQRSVYAANQRQAEQRMARHLARMGDARAVHSRREVS